MTTNNLDIDFSFKNNKQEYFLTYLTLVIINPTIQQFKVLSIAIFLIIFSIFLIRHCKFDKMFGFLFIAMLILLMVQAFRFGNFTLYSFVGKYLVILLPYFTVRLIGNKILHFFVRVLYVLAIIGLFFWIISNISSTLHGYLYKMVAFLGTDPDSGESFIIYNLDGWRPEDVYFMKNPGMFNEGGVYSCYLILAILINTILTKQLWNRYNIIFVISIISTTSTAGYIGLFLIVVIYYLNYQKTIWKIVILPVTIYMGYYAYNNLDFLGNKVETQLEQQLALGPNLDVRFGRFQSAIAGIELIKKNPIFGRGLYREDRFLSLEEKEKGTTGSSNGIVQFAVEYGIILWIIYFIYLFQALMYLCKQSGFNTNFSYFALLPILAVNSGQNIMISSLSLTIIYYGYYLKKQIQYKPKRIVSNYRVNLS